MGIVYLARNLVNGKGYVGKTKGTLESRRVDHEKGALSGNPYLFTRALIKYGFDAFSWEILFESDDNCLLLKVEKLEIKTENTKSPNGYNMTDGGEGIVGFKKTAEQLKRAGEARRGVPLGPFSVLHRQRLSNSTLTRPPVTAETRAKISAVKKIERLGKTYEEIYGVERADEERRKRSEGISRSHQFREPMSQETKDKIREGMKRTLARKRMETQVQS